MLGWRQLTAWRKRAGQVPTGGKEFLHFRGPAFEIGKQHGRALSLEIRADVIPFVKWIASRRHLELDAVAPWLITRYEGLFRERMPAVLEEVRGIAEGARLSYANAFVAALRDLMDADGCTAVACCDENDPKRPLIGQTRDSAGSPNRFRVMRFQYDSGRSMVLLNYPGWVANTGLTSDGVSFAAFSLLADSPEKPTAPGSFFKRLVLDARSTEDVIKGISGLTFPNGGYLIGDRSGHAVCIEMVAGEVSIRDISGKSFVHTNGIFDSQLRMFERSREMDASSELRQASMQRIFSERGGRVSVESLKEAFRDHAEFPLSICRHQSSFDNWMTNAAFVADLAALEIHIAIGNPCVSAFECYQVNVATGDAENQSSSDSPQRCTEN